MVFFRPFFMLFIFPGFFLWFYSIMLHEYFSFSSSSDHSSCYLFFLVFFSLVLFFVFQVKSHAWVLNSFSLVFLPLVLFCYKFAAVTSSFSTSLLLTSLSSYHSLLLLHLAILMLLHLLLWQSSHFYWGLQLGWLRSISFWYLKLLLVSFCSHYFVLFLFSSLSIFLSISFFPQLLALVRLGLVHCFRLHWMMIQACECKLQLHFLGTA